MLVATALVVSIGRFSSPCSAAGCCTTGSRACCTGTAACLPFAGQLLSQLGAP
jgi:hypothetical protein